MDGRRDSPPALQVTVFSEKGGVGRTQVAVNVAASLADHGSRVCLVDLDLPTGDVRRLLGLAPVPTDTRALVASHSPGLDVLVAPRRAEVLDALGATYDAVVVDTSGTLDHPAVQALDTCDLAVLVGTVDALSLASLEGTAGTLDLLGVPRDRWRLVLNRAGRRTGRRVRHIERRLGLPAVAVVPESRRIRAAVDAGEPVVRRTPRDGAARALDALATTLLGDDPLGTSPRTTGGWLREHRPRWRAGSR